MNRRTLLISTAAASVSALGGKAVFEFAHAQPKTGGGAMPPGRYMGPRRLWACPDEYHRYRRRPHCLRYRRH